MPFAMIRQLLRSKQLANHGIRRYTSFFLVQPAKDRRWRRAASPNRLRSQLRLWPAHRDATLGANYSYRSCGNARLVRLPSWRNHLDKRRRPATQSTTSSGWPSPNDPDSSNRHRFAMYLLEFCGVFFMVSVGLEKCHGGLLRLFGCFDAVYMVNWIYLLDRGSLQWNARDYVGQERPSPALVSRADPDQWVWLEVNDIFSCDCSRSFLVPNLLMCVNNKLVFKFCVSHRWAITPTVRQTNCHC